MEDVGVFCPPTCEVTVASVSPVAIARFATIGPVWGMPAWLWFCAGSGFKFAVVA